MAKIALLSIALCVLFLGFASAARIKSCGGSAKVDLSKIQITGCTPRKPVCHFKKGQNADMVLPFTTIHPETELTAVVHGIIGIPIPFPLPNSNACKDSGIVCPVPANTQVTYKASLPVSAHYPSIPVTVRWEIKGPNNDEVVCIEFPVHLDSKLKTRRRPTSNSTVQITHVNN